MLTIYFKDSPDLQGRKIIHNVDELFSKTNLIGNKEEKLILNEIEQGKYLSNTHYIDRFGVKLPRDCLSQGCKTALTVLKHPDKIINTIECGRNAIGSIITHCKNGRIILNSDENKIPYKNSDLKYQISVIIEDIQFTDFDKLNDYIVNR